LPVCRLAGRGGFGLVIGVDRSGHAQELKDAGAHVVVADLAQVSVAREAAPVRQRSDELPSALAALEDIKTRMKGRSPAVFLDYDGTLTPIVQRPELALLSDDMRDAVRTLAQNCTVVVMSGRDLSDVRARVGLEDIVYGGSHGFEISGPRGMHIEQQQGSEFLPWLDQVELALRERLGRIAGVLVERKKLRHRRPFSPGGAGRPGGRGVRCECRARNTAETAQDPRQEDF